MPARTLPYAASGLAVVFDREGEQPIYVECRDGAAAVCQAVKILLAQGTLQTGDRLLVLPCAVDDGEA